MQISDPLLQKRMQNRLARIEGQVRAVKKLVVESNDCEKVMQQMNATRRAMDKAFYEMLACVIEHEVAPQAQHPAAKKSMEKVKTLLAKYS